MRPRSSSGLAARDVWARALAALAVLGLAGCAPGSIEDLGAGTVFVVVAEGGGFCSSVYAVDPDGAPWTESGCEAGSSGFIQRARRASAGERAELAALADEVLALPADGDCVVPSPSARHYRLGRVSSEGAREESEQCEPGLAAPARDLATRLEALAAPDM